MKSRIWGILFLISPASGFFLIRMGFLYSGSIITLLGVYLLSTRGYKAWAYVTFISFLIISYIAMEYHDDTIIIDLFILIYLSVPQLELEIYQARSKRGLKKVLESMGITPFSVRILPYAVSKYYRDFYGLSRPLFVEIIHKSGLKKEIMYGFFDLKKHKFIVHEPEYAQVYVKTDEPVWKIVEHANRDRTPQRVSYMDKWKSPVGRDIVEDGTLSGASWRLRNSLYEQWNPDIQKWEPKPRGWTPPSPLLDQIRMVSY
jgi:hypothetical protein